MTTDDTAPILQVDDIEVVYGQIVLALRGVSLSVPRGAIVALLGANGTGKTTTLKAVSGLLAAERGELTRGAVLYQGRTVAGRTPRDLVREGLVQVLEGRHCFPTLTVEENLVTGAYAKGTRTADIKKGLDRIYAYFPRLAARRRISSGYTSGGEQQMVAIGRALMGSPELLLLDEPSMGLAPQVVAEIFEIVRALNEKERVSVLLAEQNATIALRYAHAGYIVETGRVVASGSAAELGARPDVKEFYLGVATGVRKQRERRTSTSAP